jgi:hypothetical protein
MTAAKTGPGLFVSQGRRGRERAVVAVVAAVPVVTAWLHEFMKSAPVFFKRVPRSGT